MTRVRDLTDRRSGRLTALGLVPREGWGGPGAEWFCACDCGGAVIVPSARLRNGTTKSCGCLRRENFKTQLERWANLSEWTNRSGVRSVRRPDGMIEQYGPDGDKLREFPAREGFRPHAPAAHRRRVRPDLL
jgi:hypothetical protein